MRRGFRVMGLVAMLAVVAVAVQAGAGIVFDSDPHREYEETCHKARGMMKAVEMAPKSEDYRKTLENLKKSEK